MLTWKQRLEQLENRRIRENPYHIAKKLVVLEYVRWCHHEGDMLSLPMSYTSVAGYVCAYVDKLNGSTRSVSNILSSMRTFCRLQSLPWLSESDAYRLHLLVKDLEYDDLSVSQRKRPLGIGLLRMAASKMDLQNKGELYKLTIVTVAHDALLRTHELLSGLEVGDLVWSQDKKIVTIHLKRTKTCRSGPGVLVIIVDSHSYSAVRLLRRWFDAAQLWSRSTMLVFPSFSRRAGFRFNMTASPGWYRNVIKRLVRSIGLDSRRYSGHSPRAGGATDLFDAGVAYPLIKKAGRWRSDAVMVYFRDDRHVADVVGAAFGSLAK